MKKKVWSFGGGTQTIAMAILIYQGKLRRPDRVVMADTGREFKKTWEYTEKYTAPLLAKIGLQIEIAPHSLSNVDLFSLKGGMLIPAFDARPEGNGSKLPTYCSSEWKTYVIRRHIGGAKGNPDGVEMWIGFSLDELGRLKHSGLDWCENYWPLCYDHKMTRGQCADLVESFGFPSPIKSRCKMCSHQDDTEWLEIKDEPDEWAEAVALDEQMFQSHGTRLHRSLKPLPMVDFHPRQKGESPMMDACEEGVCFI